jgi:hypothetical protein
MNILHGDSAGGSFKQAFKTHQEEIIVFHDVLSCGPLIKYADIKSWRESRENYWNNIERDNAIANLSYNILERDFYAKFRYLKDANEYRLWIGTGLSDQLLLAFLVNLIDFHGFDFRRLLIYQFERVAEKNFEVQGLGLLHPDQIRRHPSPYKLSEKQFELTKLAWDAVTDSNPEKYLLYVNAEQDSMPLLKRAMSYLFYRYPKSHNGLSYWDETLLKYSEKHGPNTAKILGYTLTDCINGLDIVGDFYLFSRLKNLGCSDLTKPLIKTNAMDLPLRYTKTTILPDGKKALSGQINIIKENGIDDWVGGVHLDSLTKNVWVRDDEEGVSLKIY